MDNSDRKEHIKKLMRDGFYRGVGWSFGVTVGFSIVSTLLVMVFNYLGGLPLVGNWFASVVQETQNALLKRSPIAP